MTIQHKLITDPDIHEPKGIDGATANKVYISNGTGSGSWEYPLPNQDTALAGQVFTSDGADSGTFSYPPAKGHGEIYITSGATNHTLSSGSAYNKLNPSGEWTASGYEDVITVNAANGDINLTLAGHYYISFWCNFTTASLASSTTYTFKFAIDGVTSPRTLTVSKFTNGADKLNVAATGILEATAGQTLSIYVAGDGTSSSTDILVTEAGLQALHLD